MSNLAVLNQAVTMSSREIADLTGKRHADVIRDIKVMKEELEQNADLRYSLKSTTYTRDDGRKYPEYLLDKEMTLTLVSGYNLKLRNAIIKRWQELEQREAQPKFQIPQTISEALRLAADLADKVDELEGVLVLKDERLDTLETYLSAGVTIVEFAKGLNGVSASKINTFLREVKAWLYKDTKGSWRVRSCARDNYLTERATTYVDKHGRVHTSYRITVLNKGARRLLAYYGKGELPMKSDWDGQFTTDKFTDE